MSDWKCAAIDHGVTIFPNGKIGPCCLIDSSYLKPISELTNPNRFKDLYQEDNSPPSACAVCTQSETHTGRSYRTMFEQHRTTAPGLQYVDIRNTNLCNLKCRSCGPHYSSKWGDELRYTDSIKKQDIQEHLPYLLTDDLHWMYFTGGEPLISKDHWDILEQLIESGRAKKIRLMYNTNLTTLKYKDKDIVSIWKQFKQVLINCSLDAAGPEINYIRSGSNWTEILQNFNTLHTISQTHKHIKLNISPTMSILNIWFFADLIKFAHDHKVPCDPFILAGPHAFVLSVIPDSLISTALRQLDQAKEINWIDKSIIERMRELIVNNNFKHTFDRTLVEIMLMDNLRNEKLFDVLPFKTHVLSGVHKFDEYQ